MTDTTDENAEKDDKQMTNVVKFPPPPPPPYKLSPEELSRMTPDELRARAKALRDHADALAAWWAKRPLKDAAHD